MAAGRLTWTDEDVIQRVTPLDRLDVIRTSEAPDRLSAADTVRHAQSLAHGERALWCLNEIDLRARPIYYRTADHVRGNTWFCACSRSTNGLRHAWAPLLVEDKALARDPQMRDPVAGHPEQEGAAAKPRRPQFRHADGDPSRPIDLRARPIYHRTADHVRGSTSSCACSRSTNGISATRGRRSWLKTKPWPAIVRCAIRWRAIRNKKVQPPNHAVHSFDTLMATPRDRLLRIGCRGTGLQRRGRRPLPNGPRGRVGPQAALEV